MPLAALKRNRDSYATYLHYFLSRVKLKVHTNITCIPSWAFDQYFFFKSFLISDILLLSINGMLFFVSRPITCVRGRTCSTNEEYKIYNYFFVNFSFLIFSHLFIWISGSHDRSSAHRCLDTLCVWCPFSSEGKTRRWADGYVNRKTYGQA